VNSTSREPQVRRMTPLYRAIRALARVGLWMMVRIRVSGEENFPSEGPLIVVTNHLHLLDSIVLMVTFPFPADVLVAEKYRRKFPIGQMVSLAGGTFVRRGEIDRKALRRCLGSLRSGRILGMAPEGTRSTTGGLQRGKPGVVYFVRKTGAPLLPIGVWGLDRMVSSWKRLSRAEVRVAIGEPFHLPVSEQRMRSEDMQALADQIMLRIAALLPRQYRGVYSDQSFSEGAGDGNSSGIEQDRCTPEEPTHTRNTDE